MPPDLRILWRIRQWDAARLDIRAVSVRLTAMACCGKDNEEKETGVSIHRSRALATRRERAETHENALTVFQTGKPRRNFDRSWRAVVAGDGAWIASRTRRRRPRAEANPRVDGFASFPSARVAHEARRSGRSDPAVNNGAAGWL